MSFLLVACVGVAHGFANPEDEYRKLIRVNEDIQPLGEHPFGENINLYDGSLSFTQTDISLPGNGPTLQLIRRFEVYGNTPEYGVAEPVFANWELEVPRLETLTAGIPPTPDNPTGMRMWDISGAGHVQGIDGWQTDNTGSYGGDPNADVNARCTNFTAPPSVVRRLGDPDLQFWDPEDWWRGYHLIMPGEGGQDILANLDSASKATYPAVTKQHWRFSCLSATANGQPGEGFLGHAPDGTLYWFDFLVYRGAESMSRQLLDGTAGIRRPSRIEQLANASIEGLISLLSGSSKAHAALMSDGIYRSLGVLLVTKVQDRFGNTLNYSYDAAGYLTGITASDGRALSITYVSGTSRIQSVTLQPASGTPRTWTYTYSSDGYSLADVALPDNSHWHYDIAMLQSTILRNGAGFGSCENPLVPSNLGPLTGTITHPSGLVGRFTVQGMRHGRSYVPKACRGMQYGDPTTTGSSAVFPEAWYALSTTQVTFSGAGTPTQTWSYGYSPTNESWSPCTGSCPTTIWTDVTAPDGSTVRNIFSNRFDISESQLLRTEYYAGAAGSSTLLRTEDSTYAAPTTANFPASAGGLLVTAVNKDQVTKYAPLEQKVITQAGDTYTWQAESFNAYIQVTQQKRSSSIAGEPVLEESLGYLNDTTLWVLGLPTTVTNVGTGEVESQNVYDSAKDTLKERWRFGQKLMSYTFDGAGNLASFTDGNNHTTTLSNYKRGIPQAIGYPDGTGESLAVDDFGQIASLTDQAGKTTSYQYDSVGRLTRINYPGGDPVAWAPKVFTYDYVTGAERGIGANHWRRTVSHGNARSVTYFDAELRPILSDTSISTDGNSHISARTDYDWRGQKTFVSYPEAGSSDLSGVDSGTITNYDGLGRAIKTQQASELGILTSTTAYLSGARVQVTDPKGKVTTTTYQVFDQPSYDNAILVQAPDGITQAITRDVYGNPLSIRQYGSYNGLTGDVTKSLYYDAYHRLCRTVEPESGSTVMAYDGANNVAWTADGLSIAGTACSQDSVLASAKTTRTYDAMNRVLTLVPPAGTQSTQYTYDARGNVQTAVSGVSTWSSSRNGLGLLTGETLQVSGQNPWTLGYDYDANGSLSSITYPDGTVVNYAPDALGRPTQAGSYATGVSYFPNGEVAAFTFGNGALYAAEQNARQLLHNFSYAKGSTLNVSEDYAYDANANITGINDLAGGPRTKSFTYDDLNRLTGATANNLWGSESYTYDPLNNIRSRSGNSTTVTYSYDATNRLTGLSDGTTFQYDPRGNVIGKSGVALTFDAKNQLQNVGGSVAYAYDASGRRVSKTPTGGDATYYFYSQAGQLMYQWEPSTAKTTDYVYLGKRMLARNEGHDSQVTGTIDGINIDASGNASISGWACSTHLAGSIAVHLYVGGPAGTGTFINGYTANVASESAVADACQAGGSNYRFNIPISMATRTQYVGQGIYIHGISPVGNSNNLIGASGDYIVPRAAVAGAPILVVPAFDSTGHFAINWSPVTGAEKYILEEQLDGGAWEIVREGTVLTLGVENKGSGIYGYRVQACSDTSCGDWSSTASVNVERPEDRPTGQIVGSNGKCLDAVNGSSNNGTAIQVWSCNGYRQQQWTLSNTSGALTSKDTTASLDAVAAGTTNGTALQLWQSSGSENQSWYFDQAAIVANGGAVLDAVAAGTSNGTRIQLWADAGTSNQRWTFDPATGQIKSATGRCLDVMGSGNEDGTPVQLWDCSGAFNQVWKLRRNGTFVGYGGKCLEAANGGTGNGTEVRMWTCNGGAHQTWELRGEIRGKQSNLCLDDPTGGQGDGAHVQLWACLGNSHQQWEYQTNSSVITAPPPVPGAVTVPPTSTGTLTVAWSASLTATSYTLQQRLSDGGWSSVYTGVSTNNTRAITTTGSYTYQVQACNSAGCSGWKASSAVAVTIPPSSAPSLSAPSNSTTGSYTVSWTGVSGATSYTLQEQTNGGGWVTTQTSGATSKAISGKGSGSYGYRVQACNAGGCGPWSSTGNVSVLLPPATPSGLVATLYVTTDPDLRPPTRYQLVASWSAVPWASSYELYNCQTSGACGTRTLTTNSAPAQLVGGATVSVQVRACNATGCSAWSATVVPTTVNE